MLRVADAPYKLSSSELRAPLLYSSGGLSNLFERLDEDRLVNRGMIARTGGA
jgi:hypothetical protein